jgi:hypothetical protein
MIPQYSDPNDRAHQSRRNKPIQRAAPRSAIQDYLAATVAAISLIERDLPVGLQIAGEEDDPTTIEFARPVATETMASSRRRITPEAAG